MTLLNKIKQTNQKHCEELSLFADIMNDNKINYVVVKGQMIAKLYPTPDVRLPGDIDFLCYNIEYDEIKEKIDSLLDIKLPKVIIEKEIAFNRNNILYELHTSLIKFRYGKHNREWNKELEYSLRNIKVYNDNICILEPTINTAYVFAHLFFHFIREGIGLRHLCDMAVILHHYRNDIDKERLEKILERIGLINAFNVFGKILIENIGLPKDDFPFIISNKYEKEKKRILTHILDGGNFGRHNRITKKSGILFKLETAYYTFKHCLVYFRLAPKEMIMMIPWAIKENLKIYFKSNS